jgi:hypothetical protein
MSPKCEIYLIEFIYKSDCARFESGSYSASETFTVLIWRADDWHLKRCLLFADEDTTLSIAVVSEN